MRDHAYLEPIVMLHACLFIGSFVSPVAMLDNGTGGAVGGKNERRRHYHRDHDENLVQGASMPPAIVAKIYNHNTPYSGLNSQARVR